jgi:hypothetical protein
LFLHLVVAHEIGHSAITIHGLAGTVWMNAPDQAVTRRLVGEAVSEYKSATGASDPVAVAAVSAIIRSWFTECLCDLLALSFLGPSFVVTMAAFSTPFGGPEPSSTHPPFTLRTKLLVEHLNARGWRPTLEKQIPRTFGWIEDIASRPADTAGSPYFARVGEIVERAATTMQSVVAQHLGVAQFEPAEFDPVAEELAELLEADILPAQLVDKRPANRKAILLAGMLRGFQKYGDDPASLPTIVADRGYQRFLTKALEMSAVLERWKGT